MKSKILEYLSDQLIQHNDLAAVYYKKYTRSQRIEHRNQYWIEYKKHKEVARSMSKAHSFVEDAK